MLFILFSPVLSVLPFCPWYTASTFALIYNDPYIKIAEEAIEAIAEVLIPSAFVVDIIIILKYVPEWFPGAKFQSKAAAMWKHAATMRNTTFEATEKIVVCNLSPFLGFLLTYIYAFPGQR